MRRVFDLSFGLHEKCGARAITQHNRWRIVIDSMKLDRLAKHQNGCIELQQEVISGRNIVTFGTLQFWMAERLHEEKEVDDEFPSLTAIVHNR